jgi:hypothetical protein
LAIEYRLVPPFLHVPEESTFADEWERFCCKLLNLEHATTEIFVRSPPEQGVDLFYPTHKIAYQCKSVESGKSGDFNTTHAIASYQSALTHQASIGWVQYVLCTNVDVTGTALTKLQSAIPRLIVLPASHWVGLCEKHPLAVERNFRVVVDVQPRHVSYRDELGDVSAVFGDAPTETSAECYTILLYSNRHDTIYRLPVRASMTVGELVNALCDLFQLPDQATFENDQISVSLSHSLVFEDRRMPFAQTLESSGIGSGAVVTYWTTIRWQDLEDKREFRGNVIHMQTLSGLAAPRSQQERKASALEAYRRRLAGRFAELDVSLEGEIGRD